MRKPYLMYPICQTSDILSWSHICELITADDPQKREFYFLTGIASNRPGINRNFLKFKQQLPSRWYAGASPAIFNSNYQQLVSNYQQFARFASVMIYKIYRFREAERRAGEKKKNPQDPQDPQDLARLRAGALICDSLKKCSF